jgi:hypothetical protein
MASRNTSVYKRRRILGIQPIQNEYPLGGSLGDWMVMRAVESRCDERHREAVDYRFSASGIGSYGARRRCSSAERLAPASNNNPDRKAQNIILTDKAKGP